MVDKTTPIQVGTSKDWQQVSAGLDYVVAIKTDGSLWAWGKNTYGGLGDGTTNDKTKPVRIGTSVNWKQVSTRWRFTAAIKTDGSLWTWGSNFVGELGDGAAAGDNKLIPTQVGTAKDWSQISAGFVSCRAIKTDGSLWAWGSNSGGQYGNGSNLPSKIPIQIGTNKDWKEVSIGETFSVALKSNGTLWAWGTNTKGRIRYSKCNRTIHAKTNRQ